MKYSTIQRENVNRGHATTIIATNATMDNHGYKPGMSPFVSRLIDNCLLYATTPDCTRSDAAVDLPKVSKVIQNGLCLSFVANSFTDPIFKLIL